MLFSLPAFPPKVSPWIKIPGILSSTRLFSINIPSLQQPSNKSTLSKRIRWRRRMFCGRAGPQDPPRKEENMTGRMPTRIPASHLFLSSVAKVSVLPLSYLPFHTHWCLSQKSPFFPFPHTSSSQTMPFTKILLPKLREVIEPLKHMTVCAVAGLLFTQLEPVQQRPAMMVATEEQEGRGRQEKRTREMISSGEKSASEGGGREQGG